MTNLIPFKFRRTKGIVWVCDLAQSSKYINDNESADDIEKFLPRLYYISKLLVESYGGIFLKWTGDGFLAFFEIELDRHKELIGKKVFEAAWHLTFMSNITQLGLKSKNKFKIRHGVTYEKDALLMKINIEPNRETLDIIGRAIVLAFRLSAIQSDFPCIVTVKELVEPSNRHFIKWEPDQEEKLKFFKGESFGIKAILVSSKNNQSKKISLKTATKKAKETISSAESKLPLEEENPMNIFTKKMNDGPEWCKKIITEEAEFIKTELLGTLKSVVSSLDKQLKNRQ